MGELVRGDIESYRPKKNFNQQSDPDATRYICKEGMTLSQMVTRLNSKTGNRPLVSSDFYQMVMEEMNVRLRSPGQSEKILHLVMADILSYKPEYNPETKTRSLYGIGTQKMVTMFNSKNKPIKISTEYYQQVLQCLNVEICTFNKQLLTENKARDRDISRLAFQQKSEPEVKEQSEGKEGHKKIGRPQAIECLANKETATTMLNSEEYLDSDEKVGTANEKSVPIKHDKSKALLSDHLVKKSDASSLQ